jgi:hypothetical protein
LTDPGRAWPDGTAATTATSASGLSVAEQSVEQLGGAGSTLVRQREDPALLDELLHAAARTTGQEQDEVLTRLGQLVFPDPYAEETVLWPVLRAVLPDGEQRPTRAGRTDARP